MSRNALLLAVVAAAVSAFDSTEIRMLEGEYPTSKRSDGQMNRFERSVDDMASGPLIRFGKRNPDGTPLIRFGRDPDASPLIRFGKRASPNGAPLIRFGRSPDAAPLIRFGKRTNGAPLIRFGRSNGAPLIRFGRSAGSEPMYR